MPYILQESRPAINKLIDQLVKHIKTLSVEEQDGNMNYAISRLLRQVYPLKYFHQNRAMGMLTCVLQEQYRKIISDYEDLKIKENGDVLEERELK